MAAPRPLASLLLAVGLGAAAAPQAPASRLIVWAWERPEDLRFLRPDVEIGVQTGFVELSGDRVLARGRRFPLLARAGQASTALVHVQIARRRPLAWTPALRAQTARAVVLFAQAFPARRVQVDFEVRASERPILLAVLGDVRKALPATTRLSMTALADWCDTERWLGDAPVDEIAPMLFRMGRGGEGLKARLAEGGDFGDPHCRTALAVSTDAPVLRAPVGRRVYLFSPRSWTAGDFENARKRVEGWNTAAH
jgi:hypothetical protein